MRIGFASIFAWRPHVEHLYFLATLARRAGHEAHFLTCDSDLPDCYARELRGRPAWLECLQCRSGGVRSFTGENVTAIGRLAAANGAAEAVPQEWAASSASTLGRFESDADYAGAEFRALQERLYPGVQMSYAAGRRWVMDNALEALCVFNGRMDATRAIFEAARSLAIPVVSLERTWFGDGLQLYPGENCLGLRSVHTLVGEWSSQPLTRAQALRAAAPIAARFLRTNVMEWRAYNTNAQTLPWPLTSSGGKRILLLPSSRNEIWGHPDWQPAWPNPGVAYDALIAHLGLRSEDLLLRCHPNWAEHIGKQDGRRAEAYYSEWARQRGIRCIASGDPASTLALIEQCDAIVVAHGSAALEAGLIGKQVIATAPSPYQHAGFRDSACNAAELIRLRVHADLEPAARAALARGIARQTLRYAYTMVYRVPQYTRYVKADATTRFRYDFSADPERFLALLRGGALRADDEQFAGDCVAEDEVLDLIAARDWQALRYSAAAPEEQPYLPLKRRLLMRPVDLVSRWKPVGGR